MHKIYCNSRGVGHNYESFKSEMIEICNEHRKDNRALAFAFIFYDFENPQIRKVLNDKDYWRALDEISGKYLTVFSFDYRERTPRGRRGRSIGDFMHYLTRIPAGVTPRSATNELIVRYFGGGFRVTYPAILFFQVDDNCVIGSCIVSLKEEEIERTFIELKEYIKNVVDVLKRIAPENKNNKLEIFNLLEDEVRNSERIRFVKRGVQSLATAASLASMIGGILR